MKKGLAIWHYHHRTQFQNIEFFADNGFEAVSMHGKYFIEIITDENEGKKLADILINKNVVLSVHHSLPVSHLNESVLKFKSDIDLIASWQQKYKLISVLSFDVPQRIRDNVTEYIDYVMCNVTDTRIALEDFALNEMEYNQISHLKENVNFGILVDIGHMHLRICGNNSEGLTLFTNSPDECEKRDKPTYNDYLKAIKHTKFQIFEIHLHSNDGKNDLHYFLEDGNTDIPAVINAIKDSGFDGILTIESAPNFKFKCTADESDRRILQTFQYLKSCIETHN